jgi:hypothetical protein
MTAIDWQTGATEVSDWADVGHPDEFRSFLGPKWTLPGIRWGWGDNDEDGFVTVSGTQLRDGTVGGRCICVGGQHLDDELDSIAESRSDTQRAATSKRPQPWMSNRSCWRTWGQS